jgi:hypothetical protein
LSKVFLHSTKTVEKVAIPSVQSCGISKGDKPDGMAPLTAHYKASDRFIVDAKLKNYG